MAKVFLPELWIDARKIRNLDAVPVIRCHDVARRMSLMVPTRGNDRRQDLMLLILS
jgi:hypothetical protein